MNLALFDFDGTITTQDTFTPFIYHAVHPKRMRLGKVVLAPIIMSYKVGLIHASIARASVVRIGFWRRSEAEIRHLGAGYARNQVAKVVRPQAVDRILWHKGRGDNVVIVSASLDAYLSAWCSDLGIGLICTTLESRAGRLTGRYLHGDCTGHEKARRIRAAYDLPSYATIYAYGDTWDDAPMLSLAHKKYFRWQEVTDIAAAAAAYGTGDPDRKSRLQEIEQENRHLERLIAEQAGVMSH